MMGAKIDNIQRGKKNTTLSGIDSIFSFFTSTKSYFIDFAKKVFPGYFRNYATSRI